MLDWTYIYVYNSKLSERNQMRHRKRRIAETAWIQLNSVTNPKTGRKHYEISVNAFKIRDFNELARIRDHFDPAHNRGPRGGTVWKYQNRDTAKNLMMLALLKFTQKVQADV